MTLLSFAGRALAAQEISDCRFAVGVRGGDEPTTHWLSRDGVFRPLLAGTREPRFGGGLHWLHNFPAEPNVRFSPGDTLAGWIELGGGLALFGWRPRDGCDGVVVRFEAGIASQFDLTSASNELVNTDYLVGLPISFRHGSWSGRLRLFHLSSHLGDELLLGHPEIERRSVSFEVLEGLAAVDGGHFRVFGGAGVILRSRTELDRVILRLGFDAWSQPWSVWDPQLPALNWVASVDLEAWERRRFEPTVHLKAGVQLARSDLGRVAFLATALTGFLPFGQFATTQRSHALGVETQIDF